MGNIRNYQFSHFDVRLTNHDYWDFYLADDGCGLTASGGATTGDCFVVWYDFSNPAIFPNSATTSPTILSLVTWDGAINTGYTLNTIGLTGIDNGLVTFERDENDPTNQALLSALTGTTLVIPSGDTRMVMNLVTGTTGNYVYPTQRIIDPSIGDYTQFCGGFYQGYYKIDGTTYEVLPTRYNNGWTAEFWLNPQDICNPTTGTTLNDVYPNNYGFFFYMGTRAENKFWNYFSGVDSGCTSACTATTGCTDVVSPFCTIPREPDVMLVGEYGIGIPLSPPSVEVELITNQFLIYGRAYDSSPPSLTGDYGTIIIDQNNTISGDSLGCGCMSSCCCNLNSDNGLGTKTVCTYDGNGIAIAKTKTVLTDSQNPFLIYGRAYQNASGCTCSACSGNSDGLGNQTVCTYSGRTGPETEINYNLDIIDNALGFRIKQDGSIGYRLMTITGQCYTASTGERLYSSGITIQEAYSEPMTVASNAWSYVAIRYMTQYLDDCDLKTAKRRTGRLMFYVNARLKFVVDEFPEFIARRLQENSLKQVAVPFNFSLGGGSQGLIDSQTFDGLDMADRGLPIEENFAGTFIGGIKDFRFNICDLTFADIQFNYLNNDQNPIVPDTNLLLTEDGFLLLQENGYGIIWL
jgi:hypothetical protein